MTYVQSENFANEMGDLMTDLLDDVNVYASLRATIAALRAIEKGIKILPEIDPAVAENIQILTDL